MKVFLVAFGVALILYNLYAGFALKRVGLFGLDIEFDTVKHDVQTIPVVGPVVAGNPNSQPNNTSPPRDFLIQSNRSNIRFWVGCVASQGEESCTKSFGPLSQRRDDCIRDLDTSTCDQIIREEKAARGLP
jgi:hypothetical protein